MAKVTQTQKAGEDAAVNPFNKLFGENSSTANSLKTQLNLQDQLNNGPEKTTGLGTDTFDQAVNNYRTYGAGLQNRAAPQLDQRQANESRGLQLDALSQLRRQASGEAPSAANIMAQRANQNAISAAGQNVTGAKSTGGALAALRNGYGAEGNAMLAGNAQNAAARAGEISQGQQGYAAGAGAVRGQDITGATANAQLTAQQRALNEAGQQTYETMAQNTQNARLNAGQVAQQQMDTNKANLREIQAGEAQKQSAAGMTAINTAVGAGTAGASLAAQKGIGRAGTGSDERMKTHIGSLSALMRGRR